MALDQTMNLTGRVKLDLTKLIETADMKPGDKLPPADELCDRFSVSRTVVREAIASLKAEGRLRSLRGSGVYVATPPAPTGSPFGFMSSPQDIAGVLEFMEFRIAVETEAAALAATRRTETDLLHIESALVQLGADPDDPGADTAADTRFHRAIADAANNRRFQMFVAELGERLIPRRALGAGFADEKSRAEFLDVIRGEHRDIFDAISERDPEAARRAMRKHLEDGRKRYRVWSLANSRVS